MLITSLSLSEPQQQMLLAYPRNVCWILFLVICSPLPVKKGGSWGRRKKKKKETNLTPARPINDLQNWKLELFGNCRISVRLKMIYLMDRTGWKGEKGQSWNGGKEPEHLFCGKICAGVKDPSLRIVSLLFMQYSNINPSSRFFSCCCAEYCSWRFEKLRYNLILFMFVMIFIRN